MNRGVINRPGPSTPSRTRPQPSKAKQNLAKGNAAASSSKMLKGRARRRPGGARQRKRPRTRGQTRPKRPNAQPPTSKHPPPHLSHTQHEWQGPMDPIPPFDSRTETTWRDWVDVDFLVVCVLWAVEVPQAFVDSFKEKVLAGEIAEKNVNYQRIKIRKNLEMSLSARVILMIATSILTMATGWFARNWTFKFWIVVVGLYIYSFTNFAGFMLFQIDSPFFIVALRLLDMFWHITNPLRYYLIFHQRFPIRISRTRQLVTINETLVGYAVYFSMIFVSQVSDFHEKTYTHAFIWLFIFMLLWVTAVHFVKPFLIEKPIEIPKIEEIYQETEVITNFKHRNAKWTMIIFTLLFIPSTIFPVLSTVLTMIIEPFQESFFFYYRLDLFASVLVMMVVEAVAEQFKNARDETEDLWSIGLGHVANVVALSVFVVLSLTVVTVQPPNGDEPSERVLKGTAEITILYPEQWKGKMLVKDVDDDVQQPLYLRTTGMITRVLNTNGTRVANIEGTLKGEHIFSGQIKITEGETFYYFLEDKNTPLIPLNIQVPEAESDSVKVFVINLNEICSKPNEPIRLKDQEDCTRVTINLRHYKDGTFSTLNRDYSGEMPIQYTMSNVMELKGTLPNCVAFQEWELKGTGSLPAPQAIHCGTVFSIVASPNYETKKLYAYSIIWAHPLIDESTTATSSTTSTTPIPTTFVTSPTTASTSMPNTSSTTTTAITSKPSITSTPTSLSSITTESPTVDTTTPSTSIAETTPIPITIQSTATSVESTATSVESTATTVESTTSPTSAQTTSTIVVPPSARPTPKPHKDPPASVVSMTSLAGIGMGVAEVGYIHFAWIMCPYVHRAPVLAAYFTYHYIVQCTTDITLQEINTFLIVVLFVISAIFMTMHIVLSFIFSRGLPPIPEEVDIENRRF